MLNESLCITWIINFISWNQINLLHIQRTIDNTTPYDWLAKNDPHACSWSASCCTPETSDAISCIDLFWCWAYASSVWYKDDCTWVSWNYVLSHWLLILNPNLLKKCMCQIVKSLSLGQGRFQGGGTGPPPIGKDFNWYGPLVGLPPAPCQYGALPNWKSWNGVILEQLGPQGGGCTPPYSRVVFF